MLAAAEFSRVGDPPDGELNDPETDEMIEAEWAYYGHEQRAAWLQPSQHTLPPPAPRLLRMRKRVAPRARSRRVRSRSGSRGSRGSPGRQADPEEPSRSVPQPRLRNRDALARTGRSV